ncbi:MAG: putative hydrolase of the superfamily [Phycisphaerales bacterium]|nr:putative hydrolase of the superfamily [Phycisphaerales bacterium]
MIRAVLFDFDDTLVDFRPADPRALFEAGAARVYAYLTARGCSLPAFAPFCSRQRWAARRIAVTTRLRGRQPDGRRLLRRICNDFRLQRDEVSLAKLGWLWYEPVIENAELPADVIPTLAALRDGDVKLGLVVNTIHQGQVIDRHLESLGLLEFFPVRVYSSELAVRKPSPQTFAAALKQLDVPAAETLFVGDDPKLDIFGAQRAGMRAVVRHAPHSPHRPGRGMADYSIERIGQLLDIFDIVPATAAQGSLRIETISPTPIISPIRG